jgi:hypothetical protein
MSERHKLQAYDYVNRPYEAIRDALLANMPSIFRRATMAAAEGNRALGAELHAKAGPFDLGTEIEIEIGSIEAGRSPDDRPATKIALEWKAARNPRLFPTMKATLSVYPLSATETQLDLAGVYHPPLGIVGEAIDAIAMHRIAEESVAGFVRDVAAWLRGAPSARAAAAGAGAPAR